MLGLDIRNIFAFNQLHDGEEEFIYVWDMELKDKIELVKWND